MLPRFIFALTLSLVVTLGASAQDATDRDATDAAEQVVEQEVSPQNDEAEPPDTRLADLRRDLQGLEAQHGDLVRGVVEHGLRALHRAETRGTAGDVVGKERALAIAEVARSVAEKRAQVRAAQGRLRLLRSRIASLRARAES